VTFEQIIQRYIYLNKRLSLNLFGTIELESAIPDNELLKKEKGLAVDGLHFKHEPNVITDRAFIEFYAAEKKRILPLAESDVETQLGMAKQIVNIGNPMDLPGLGKIVKQNNGTLVMMPGLYSPIPVDGMPAPAPMRERISVALPGRDRDSDFHRSEPVADKGLPWLKIFFTAAALAGVILVIWLFVKFALPALMPGDKTVPEEGIVESDPQADTTASIVAIIPDTTNNTVVIDSFSPIGWKANIRMFTDSLKADFAMKKYQGYQIDAKMDHKDSNQYVIYIPMQISLKDTAFKRDSLSRFFASKVWLERLQP
jgi:RNAse (barnase) inhibitor barstar